MEQKTDTYYPSKYPSQPSENNDLEGRLENKIIDFNSFNKHINHIKEKITYFKDREHKAKRNIKIINL